MGLRVRLIAPAWTRETLKRAVRRAKVFNIPPLGLLNVAAVTPDDVEAVLTDENVEQLSFDKDADLVGITVMTTSAASRAYEIADRFRAMRIPVVLGGSHVSVLPQEAAEHADAVVIGEAEGVWERLIGDFKQKGAKGLRRFYKNETLPDLSEIPFPRWDLLKKGKYIVTKVLRVTRGCPYNCSFCSVTKLFGRRVRVRPIEKVAEFIGKNLGRPLSERVFVFLDDNITANRNYAKRLFEALIPFNLTWLSACTVNAAYDRELLELAGRSGCKALFVGLESIFEDALAEIGKSQNKVEFYKEAIKRFHEHGITVEGAFIFGFDSDDKGVFKRTVKFSNRVKLDGVQYSILTPLPGTDLYQKLESEGRLIDRDWANYDCAHVVFQPKRMSPQELAMGSAWSCKKIHSLFSIFTRLTGILKGGRWRYLLPLLIFNLGSRKAYFEHAEHLKRGASSFANRKAEDNAHRCSPTIG